MHRRARRRSCCHTRGLLLRACSSLAHLGADYNKWIARIPTAAADYNQADFLNLSCEVGVFHFIRNAVLVLLFAVVINHGGPAGPGGDTSLALAQSRRDPFGDRREPTRQEIELQKA